MLLLKFLNSAQGEYLKTYYNSFDDAKKFIMLQIDSLKRDGWTSMEIIKQNTHTSGLVTFQRKHQIFLIQWKYLETENNVHNQESL